VLVFNFLVVLAVVVDVDVATSQVYLPRIMAEPDIARNPQQSAVLLLSFYIVRSSDVVIVN
jgi:hypothetical protein